MSVHIYVEGGGEGAATSSRCRQAFAEFFRKMVPKGSKPKVIACGSRNETFDRFKTALEERRNEFALLLVDSEGPIVGKALTWSHLKKRDRWDRPALATDDSAHLMVQCMESWFLADREALARYYGQGFRPNSLPRRENIEQISKEAVYQALENATRDTKTKGRYHKTRHGFDLLTFIDPVKVKSRSTHAERLCLVLLRKLAE